MTNEYVYVPTIESVNDCRRRLFDAGGILETHIIEEDYFLSDLQRAAQFIVIEGVRYWEALEEPNLEGLEHEPLREESDYSLF